MLLHVERNSKRNTYFVAVNVEQEIRAIIGEKKKKILQNKGRLKRYCNRRAHRPRTNLKL